MGKTIKETNVPYLAEPRFLHRRKAGQYLVCSGVKGVTWKMAYHVEEAKLFLMVECFARKGARHEEDESLRCSRIQFKEAGESVSVVLIKNIQFPTVQDKT